MGYVEKILVIMRFSVRGNNDIHSIAVETIRRGNVPLC